MKYQTLQKKGLDQSKLAVLLNMAYLHVDCADSFVTDLRAELKKHEAYRLNVKHDVNKIKSMIGDFLREIKTVFSNGEQEGFGDIADFLKYITTQILLGVKTEEDIEWFQGQINKMLTERTEFGSEVERLKKQKISLQNKLYDAEQKLIDAGIKKPAIREDVSHNA